MQLSWVAFLDVQSPAVLFRTIFDNAHRKPGSQIDGIFRRRHRQPAILTHRFETGERRRLEGWSVE